MSFDPFDYPMGGRQNLMSFNKIENADGTNQSKFLSKRNVSANLDTHDIEGAQPKLHGSRSVKNKPQFQYTNVDIDRAAPKQLHMGLEKAEYNLTNNDIEGSQPNMVKFKTSRMGTNPLAPQYKIPTVDYKPPTPPKYLRDNIDINDIDGARPKKPPYYETRDTMKVGDIEGAKPTKMKQRGSGAYNNLDYSDISKKNFVSQRVVNPLNPTYQVQDENGRVQEYGAIEGSGPKGMPERKRGGVSQDLQTSDIEGAKAGTKGLGAFVNRNRSANLRNPIACDDIEGAHAGSHHKGTSNPHNFKGPTSKRQTNPLNPSYQLIGGSEITEDYSPYGKFEAEQRKQLAEPKSLQERERELNAWKLKEQMKKNIFPTPSNETRFQQNDYNKYSPFEKAANEQLKNNLANFYGLPAKEVKTGVTMNQLEKIHQKALVSGNVPKIDPQYKQDPIYRKNHNVFFGTEPTESCRFQANTQKFFAATPMNGNQVTEENLEKLQAMEKMKSQESEVDHRSGIYKKNMRKFHGLSSRASDASSVFQKDFANFYDLAPPQRGQRYVKKEQLQYQDFSKQNPRKEDPTAVKRDPLYQKNADNFYGIEVPVPAKPQMTYAQKLDRFVQY